MLGQQDNMVVVSRTFAAPLESLWRAWTDPEHFKQWYGPRGFSVPICAIELEVGGHHLWCMQSPDGMQMYYAGYFKEVVPMERLVYTDGMTDAEGNPISHAAMGMPEGLPMSMDVTVTFAREDGKTRVTVSHVGFGEGGDQAWSGWEQAFDKLSAVLAHA
jgi:uncharacterized protein YndB with AHSA1/START domain